MTGPPTEPLWTPPAEQLKAAETHGAGERQMSYSKLGAYRRCGEKYRLRHVDKVPTEPSGAAFAGSAVHEVIEAMSIDGWFRKPEMVETYGRDEFIKSFHAKLEEVGGPDKVRWGGRATFVRDDEGHYLLDTEGNRIKQREQVLWWERMGPTHVKRAGSILRDDEANGATVVEANVERRVAAWLDGPGSLLITGIIDLMLVADAEGNMKLRDWKTGTYIDELQLVNYAWLLAHIEDPSARIIVDIGEIAYLRGATKDKWIRTYDLRTELEAGTVTRMFADAEAGIAAGIFQLNPSSFCSSCEVRAYCPHGKVVLAKQEAEAASA